MKGVKMKFTFGTMGGSKTAQALMKRFHYEEHGMPVFLAKPSADNRDGKDIIQSRIGLKAPCYVIHPEDDIVYLVHMSEAEARTQYKIIIIDEAQFLKMEQVDQLRTLADAGYIVHCYGLKTTAKTKLFDGSKRLFEVCDEFEKIDTVCRCGRPADVNARVENGMVVLNIDTIDIGGNDKYRPMCHKCFREAVANHPPLHVLDTERLTKIAFDLLAMIYDRIPDSDIAENLMQCTDLHMDELQQLGYPNIAKHVEQYIDDMLGEKE